eukprot:2395209-Prymnesium_polylepis.5
MSSVKCVRRQRLNKRLLRQSVECVDRDVLLPCTFDSASFSRRRAAVHHAANQHNFRTSRLTEVTVRWWRFRVRIHRRSSRWSKKYVRAHDAPPPAGSKTAICHAFHNSVLISSSCRSCWACLPSTSRSSATCLSRAALMRFISWLLATSRSRSSRQAARRRYAL